jgi:hypothetical protein
MACEIVSCEGAVFVLWGKPTKPDVDRVIGRLQLVSDKSGRPVVYITRVPIDAPAPDADVRQYINSNMKEAVRCCSSYHVVLEGNGFVAAVKRAVLSSFFQISWRNGIFFVHSVSKEAVYKLERDARSDAEKVLHLAERAGLLTGSGPPEPGVAVQSSHAHI